MINYLRTSIVPGFLALRLLLLRSCDALSIEPNLHPKAQAISRRAVVRKFLVQTAGTITAASNLLPVDGNAAADEGISVVTDSNIGRAVRRSAIRGARVADDIDERWERFSDGLRDKSKCDANTGRRMYDNGFRKDGTPVGNPVLGALCRPESLQPLDESLAEKILELALQSASQCVGVSRGKGEPSTAVALEKLIRQTEELVRPSFDRSINNSVNEEDRRRKQFNFSFYSKMRAINTFLNDRESIRKFKLTWGKALVSQLAPSANRNDYSSPFPEIKDKIEDYDYNKNSLLDGLGALKASLEVLKAGGLLGSFELSIPYDDYGSVVTVAIDDYLPIESEILLAEQQWAVAGPAQALVRHVMDKAQIDYALDTFYIDPSTTKQSEYNPTQLLLSLSNLSAR